MIFFSFSMHWAERTLLSIWRIRSPLRIHLPCTPSLSVIHQISHSAGVGVRWRGMFIVRIVFLFFPLIFGQHKEVRWHGTSMPTRRNTKKGHGLAKHPDEGAPEGWDRVARRPITNRTPSYPRLLYLFRVDNNSSSLAHYSISPWVLA